ncbi:hypothetical protein NUW58_g9113 [Xylaria curta]|uniref:Uncharacterized protein n=1 Tax=Xylaria curta TaxID=42375 RepID=A0ACC1N1K0_9PEZI|nr:hypothetical protein NUW58_g9113 [Xylaria curta]
MYKLVERQDLFCFTLEREGVVQGAFWVPRWATDLWMRPNGTPDILMMLSEHIANRPVLPILEMNSVLNTAGFGIAPPTRALPNDPVNPNIHPDLTSNINPNASIASPPDGLATDNSNSNEEPTPGPSSATPNAQNAQGDAGRNINGLDASLGAGYAILPDKTDATMLWLRSAVEMLRQRIPQCPKPRFLTLTDFQTAEKNILVEVSKGGTQHRQMHIVFGRVLANDEDNSAHHGVRTRKPRVETGLGRSTDDTEGPDDGQGDGGGDAEQEDGDGEQIEEEGDDEQEDQDMDGDHDSDADIARQLTAGHVHNDLDNENDPDRHTSYNDPSQDPVHTYHPSPQQNLEHPQSHDQNVMPGLDSMSPGLSSSAHDQRHPAMQAQVAYNPMIGRMPDNMMP